MRQALAFSLSVDGRPAIRVCSAINLTAPTPRLSEWHAIGIRAGGVVPPMIKPRPSLAEAFAAHLVSRWGKERRALSLHLDFGYSGVYSYWLYVGLKSSELSLLWHRAGQSPVCRPMQANWPMAIRRVCFPVCCWLNAFGLFQQIAFSSFSGQYSVIPH